MSKKDQEVKIVETEPILIDEKDIITDEVPVEDTIEVEAPEVIIENSDGDIKTEESSVEAPKTKVISLKIEVSFCDKYTNVSYKIGDVVEFKEARAKELLKDKRNLVSKAK